MKPDSKTFILFIRTFKGRANSPGLYARFAKEMCSWLSQKGRVVHLVDRCLDK